MSREGRQPGLEGLLDLQLELIRPLAELAALLLGQLRHQPQQTRQ
jgi:hypothetical protein